MIFDETNTDFPHLDAAKVHIQAIARAIGAQRILRGPILISLPLLV
jgi:hypothetical protein